METIRSHLEAREEKSLSAAGFRSRLAERRVVEDPCPLRTAFQVDRDRIQQSKAFRRLKYKTQVFLSPAGDHYRTRLTHTLEVAQIARTVARALGLNEDLTEAISLGHDLGHTPFGHAGERILDQLLPGGFRHVRQSVRVVERLEEAGQGLNLTSVVIDGIAHHSKGQGPLMQAPAASLPITFEGQVVRFADIIAYVNHDLDDAVRAGLVRERDLPSELVRVVGRGNDERLRYWMTDMIQASTVSAAGRVSLSEPALEAVTGLRDWLYQRVYRADEVHREFLKAARVLEELFGYFVKQPEALTRYGALVDPDEPVEIAIADFLAGMTDRFALNLYRKLFLPEPWKVL